MGQSLSLCQSCTVDIDATIATIEREQERVNREIDRLRERIHNTNDIVNKNLLTVSVQMSEIKIQLATICTDIQYIKKEVENEEN